MKATFNHRAVMERRRLSSSDVTSYRLFTLHARIRDVDRTIWHRLQVEGGESFRNLHHIRQATATRGHLLIARFVINVRKDIGCIELLDL